MQFACFKKKSELEAKQKKEEKTSNEPSKTKSKTPVSQKKKETPVYSEYQKSSPSLKNISTKNNEVDKNDNPKETEAINENRPSQIFSEDELKTAWLRYAEINKENLPRMYQVFQNHIPIKIDDNKLMIQLDSDSQKKDFIERIHSDLMRFLKEELSNYSIELTVDLLKEIQNENLIYTATDKFKYLSELNPEIESLKKKFNLDFD
ncbi:MAG: hypothetical protein PF517_04925 [Salinivirgaceae bacterium]|jgi:DNA polymerase-3 subunit gamma/tau|nr:hypothetical protein [Salinivirgaceae bacterium]